MGGGVPVEFRTLHRVGLRLAVAMAGCVGVALVALPGSAVADPSCSQSGSTVTCLYFFTGSQQSFVVPGGVQSIAVSASGAQGGAGAPDSSPNAAGGEGARVQVTLPVTPGQTLAVLVGGQGARGDTAAGFNGGGDPGGCCGNVPESAGQGGGASDVRIAPFGLTDRLVVAGGGGGGGGNGAGDGPGHTGGPAGGRGGAGGDPGMAGSDLSGSVIGGQPGAGGTGQGGAGGGAGTPGGSAGLAGSLGQGGSGGGMGVSGAGGAGGGAGGGFVGGGGGGGGGASGEGGGGGGGGGGSSFVEPFATGESVTSGAQSGSGMVAISYGVPDARAVDVSFPGVQLQDTISAAQTIEVINDGAAPLEVSAMTFSGANPEDFVIAFNGCLGPVAPQDLCTIGVSFTPQARGPRTADLNIASNDPSSPLTVGLSGTGGAAVQSASGATESKGRGRIVLMTCKPTTRRITRNDHKVRVKLLACSSRQLLGKGTLPITERDTRAKLSQSHKVSATGFAVPTGHGRWQLVLQAKRKLRRGSYTLVLRSRHHRRSVTHRERLLLR
jgi:hypothetical protein